MQIIIGTIVAIIITVIIIIIAIVAYYAYKAGTSLIACVKDPVSCITNEVGPPLKCPPNMNTITFPGNPLPLCVDKCDEGYKWDNLATCWKECPTEGNFTDIGASCYSKPSTVGVGTICDVCPEGYSTVPYYAFGKEQSSSSLWCYNLDEIPEGYVLILEGFPSIDGREGIPSTFQERDCGWDRATNFGLTCTGPMDVITAKKHDCPDGSSDNGTGMDCWSNPKTWLITYDPKKACPGDDSDMSTNYFRTWLAGCATPIWPCESNGKTFGCYDKCHPGTTCALKPEYRKSAHVVKWLSDRWYCDDGYTSNGAGLCTADTPSGYVDHTPIPGFATKGLKLKYIQGYVKNGCSGNKQKVRSIPETDVGALCYDPCPSDQTRNSVLPFVCETPCPSEFTDDYDAGDTGLGFINDVSILTGCFKPTKVLPPAKTVQEVGVCPVGYEVATLVPGIKHCKKKQEPLSIKGIFSTLF